MVQLSPRQREILTFDLKERPWLTILEGAVRSGKTFLDNAFFYKMVRSHTGMGLNYIVTGHTLGSVKRNVLDPLGEEFQLNITTDNQGSFELFGNKIHCFGADKTDSFKAMTGMTAAGWYGNEVTLQHKNTILEGFKRCSYPGARIYWDTNPDFPEHYIKIDYIDHDGELQNDGRLRIKSWHFDLEDNPFLPAEYVENLKATIPEGFFYDRYINGLWVAAEGSVYPEFRREHHVYKDMLLPESWSRVRAIDFGYTNPFVCLWGALDSDGRLFIYDEHYKTRTLIRDHAALIGGRNHGYLWTVSDHDAQDIAELRELGIFTRNAQKDVIPGIQKVKARLKVQGDGWPRLLVSDKCVNTIKEFSSYRWQESKADRNDKEEPNKEADHAMDALRYMVMELDNTRGKVGELAGVLGL